LTINNPLDLLKVRAQVNRDKPLLYRNAIPLLFKEEGIKGFWKGVTPQLMATPGTGIYFFTYEYLKKWMEI
jgi:hypothetical protein